MGFFVRWMKWSFGFLLLAIGLIAGFGGAIFLPLFIAAEYGDGAGFTAGVIFSVLVIGLVAAACEG